MPPTLYMWPMVAFATAVLLNLLALAFERRPVKRQLCFLAVFISGVAFVYEFLAWKQSAPIYVTATGRPISLLRCGRRGRTRARVCVALWLWRPCCAARGCGRRLQRGEAGRGGGPMAGGGRAGRRGSQPVHRRRPALSCVRRQPSAGHRRGLPSAVCAALLRAPSCPRSLLPFLPLPNPQP